MHVRSMLRLITVVAGSGFILTATAVAATAHVKVYTYTPAVQGGDAALVFRVPTEEQANTVKLTVSMPSDAPIPSVSVMQKAGWTVTVAHRTLSAPVQTDDGPVTSVVSSVTWTASAGGGIPPDSYDEFDLSAESLPQVATLAFPAVQTYANGDVVRWIEPTPANGDEPDHPVPVLDLVPAGGSSAASSTAPADAASVSTKSNDSDSTARALGVAGIVVGGLGLIVAAAVALTRRHS
jgi:periplasmic copper chaperone A